MNDFEKAFHALTGRVPFPWQTALYNQLVSEDGGDFPSACNLPTGLGKTLVIAVWLVALSVDWNLRSSILQREGAKFALADECTPIGGIRVFVHEC